MIRGFRSVRQRYMIRASSEQKATISGADGSTAIRLVSRVSCVRFTVVLLKKCEIPTYRVLYNAICGVIPTSGGVSGEPASMSESRYCILSTFRQYRRQLRDLAGS